MQSLPTTKLFWSLLILESCNPKLNGKKYKDQWKGRYCCCWITSVVSDSVWPHRQQPTGLPHPWASPGKNTGVDCHFLLQCMKVKSESDVAQSCLTLSNPMDCGPPGSSIHGVWQARVLERGAIAFSKWKGYLLLNNICQAFHSFCRFFFFFFGGIKDFRFWAYIQFYSLISSLNILQIFFMLFNIFCVFWGCVCHEACGILVSQSGIKPMSPAVEAWRLNHQTTRKVPSLLFNPHSTPKIKYE